VSAVAVNDPAAEASLVHALRAGDERAFAELIDRLGPALLRVARFYVRDRAVAEEVVQETWLSVLEGIERFEGRSSLKTWVFRILANRAKTRAGREARTVPMSALEGAEPEDGPSVEPERFRGPDDRWAGHWASPPASWSALPENRLVSKETIDCIRSLIAALPPAQREVIALRDVEGWPSDEVCALLGLSEVNQRVLLHRARSKVRAGLERYLAEE
jgi:RNA polymerase sigma-70 factor (ECF subfamily)